MKSRNKSFIKLNVEVHIMGIKKEEEFITEELVACFPLSFGNSNEKEIW